MQNPRLADRYAKSLMDIAIEQGKLDAMYQDMQGLKSICDSSNEFTNLMKSPIVKSDTKLAVLKAMIEGKVDGITMAFVDLILKKGREFFLPEIVLAFITQYKKYNKINEVKLTTATPLDDQILDLIKQNVQKQFPDMTIDMTHKIDESLLGGFIVESNNNQFDASIIRDLREIKKQFLKNEYIPSI